MAYPTPSLYLYRVREVPAVHGVTPARYVPEFSTDSGSTYRALSGIAYENLTEAFNQIGFVVQNEVTFKRDFLAGRSHVPAAAVNHSYPPS